VEAQLQKKTHIDTKSALIKPALNVTMHREDIQSAEDATVDPPSKIIGDTVHTTTLKTTNCTIHFSNSCQQEASKPAQLQRHHSIPAA
jgi:hypothetical protein